MNEVIGRILAYTILFAGAFVISFVAHIFMLWDISPSEWSIVSRFSTLVAAISMAMYYLMVHADEK